MGKYDEASVLKELAKKCVIDYSGKVIYFNPNGNCGNSTFGKIDFLTKYCCWVMIKSKQAVPTKSSDSPKKKAKKSEPKEEHKLTNKKK